MDNEKEKKIKNLQEGKQKKARKKVSPEHQKEQEDLLFKANAISPANKKINKAEVVQTIGGEQINVDDYVEENYLNYSGQSTHFHKETFYYPLADMFGVDRKRMDEYIKPTFVPDFINQYILARFPMSVINRIQDKNRYISFCRRKYYHYQVMTIKADNDYRLFIEQVEKILEKKPTLNQFKKEYCTLYNLPRQKDLFEED